MKKTTQKITDWKTRHLRNKMMTALFVTRRELLADEKSDTRRAKNTHGCREHVWDHRGIA